MSWSKPRNGTKMDAVLIVLSIVGFTVSTYFTGVAYRWIRPDARWIPSFCRMGEQTCASIVFTPRARVFGLPNSLLGQIYYLALSIGIPLGLLAEPRVLVMYMCVSLLTVVLAVYLSYSLLVLTRVPCKLCFTSHGINVVIFILLLNYPE